MNIRHEDEVRIAERAAEWQLVLNRTGAQKAGEKECAQFMAWLEESPRHLREFLLLQAWEMETAGFDAERKIDVDAIVAKAAANIVPLKNGPHLTPTLSRPKERRGRRMGRGILIGVAASITVAAAVLGWVFLSPQTYSTAIGELRTVELSDGSRIELNTASRVQVALSDEAREVKLLEGEALFKVERDAARPFRVRAGANVIQAVGTQFTVNRRPLGTMVSVLEGSVRIFTDDAASAGKNLLAAGEEARIDMQGHLEKREPLEGTTNLAAWHRRRLVFRDDALADIAAEFNRYNRNLQIVVEGNSARYKRYGGIFDADDPESIVRFVAQDDALTVRRETNRIVIY